MAFAETEICEVTESIWRSVLGLDVRRGASGSAHDGRRRFLTGCVQVTGAWEGAITVDCSAALARRAAGIMFDVDPDSAELPEIQDALGELTNMTGGNIKNLLPSPSLLSLPSVTEGLDYSVSVPGGRLLTEVSFECQGEPLLVRVLKKEDAQSGVGGRGDIGCRTRLLRGRGPRGGRDDQQRSRQRDRVRGLKRRHRLVPTAPD